MGKRRINEQQSRRINTIQSNYQNNNLEACSEGLVLTRFGHHAEIETNDKVIVHCAIRPNLDSLVAGDKVIWQTSGPQQGVVVSRFPRHSVLERVDKQGEPRPVAANISQLVIVVAVQPELSWTLLDSYLVMAEYFNLRATIVLNKVDIPCAAIQQQLENCYPPLGYSLIFTSEKNMIGYEQLLEALNEQVSVFVGQSGVGKSSLIARILPEQNNISIGKISEHSELGCHTTRNSRYYHLANQGALIDSPGVREFKLNQLPKANIVAGFLEFRALSANCKYRNCDHHIEAGCAIIAALKAEQISSQRYKSFTQIIKQLALD